MNHAAIYHAISGAYCFPTAHNRLCVRLRLDRADSLLVRVRYLDRYLLTRHGIGSARSAEMERVYTDEYTVQYEAVLDTGGMNSVYYAFELIDGDAVAWFAGDRFHACFEDLHDSDFFVKAWVSEADIADVPEWAQDAVVYQIVPERYACGDASISPPDCAGWYDPVDYLQFIGGDLAGIAGRLDYIAGLGVNTLYLTPVFTAPSTHKYDTADFYTIDPHFGTESDLKRLVTMAHDRGIRVILDAVFNHTGREFFAFRDILENGEKSRYRDWYHITRFPVDPESRDAYRTYGGYASMPKLNTANPAVAAYLMEVVRYWMTRCAIDGWRIDAADQVSHEFWRLLRRTVKECNPDALIGGEIWNDASAYLEGDQFDTVMNYPFMQAAVALVRDGVLSAEDFVRAAGVTHARYRNGPAGIVWNHLATHDTRRYLAGDPSERDSLFAAVALQLCWPGVPFIYYGEECGMRADKRHSRGGMWWDKDRIDQEVFLFYREMIALRRESAALSRGDCRVIRAASGLLHFRRECAGERVDVIVNCGARITYAPADGGKMIRSHRAVSGLSGDHSVEIDFERYGFAMISGEVAIEMD